MCMYLACVSLYASMCRCLRKPEVLDPIELEVQAWLPNPGYFSRAVDMLTVQLSHKLTLKLYISRKILLSHYQDNFSGLYTFQRQSNKKLYSPQKQRVLTSLLFMSSFHLCHHSVSVWSSSYPRLCLSPVPLLSVLGSPFPETRISCSWFNLSFLGQNHPLKICISRIKLKK